MVMVMVMDEMVENRKRINIEIQELLAMESNEPEPKKMKTSDENVMVSFSNFVLDPKVIFFPSRKKKKLPGQLIQSW